MLKNSFASSLSLSRTTLGAVLGTTALVASSSIHSQAQEKLQVVASYSVACDLVQQVAGDAADMTCLVAYESDPHAYEAAPSDRRAIEQADVVFYGGYNFEPSIIEMAEATDTPAPKVALHEEAVPDPIFVEEEGESEPDPHVWHDVENGIAMAEVVAATLSELDPDNAELYASNTDALVEELQTIDQWIQTQVDTIPEDQRQLVTTHDATNYYADAYGLTVAGTLLGISTEDVPSAATLRELVTAIEEANVPTLFAELTANDQVLGAVSRESGIPISENVLIADGLGPVETPEGTYQGMLVYNTCTIVDGLGGECSLP
jgi:ABC-type Zn uptake system ZnuABC Zn-binding protein ZnuA